MARGGFDLLQALGLPSPTGDGGRARPAAPPRAATPPPGDEPGPAPAYSVGLEFALSLLLQKMDARGKLALARRMLEVFRHLEREALAELGGSEPDEVTE